MKKELNFKINSTKVSQEELHLGLRHKDINTFNNLKIKIDLELKIGEELS